MGGSGIPKVVFRSYNSSIASKDLYNAVPTSLGDNRWTCTFTLSTTDGTIPDPNEIGMQVVIYANEANNAPDEWSVWETKLEVGSVVTPFIARSHGEELALCHRYYQILAGYAFSGACRLGGAIYGNTVYPVEMRSVPSVSDTGTPMRFNTSEPFEQTSAGFQAAYPTTRSLRVYWGDFVGLTRGEGASGAEPADVIVLDAEL